MLLPSFVTHCCVSYLCQIFSVRLTLGDQHWEADGTSIKKAQHSAAASALAETTLPKPTVRTPRNISKNPGRLFLCATSWSLFNASLNFAERDNFIFAFLYFSLTADGMAHSVELNALCMKLGKKPVYKPIDPFPGMRQPNFSYNVRAPGPYQRSMQQ